MSLFLNCTQKSLSAWFLFRNLIVDLSCYSHLKKTSSFIGWLVIWLMQGTADTSSAQASLDRDVWTNTNKLQPFRLRDRIHLNDCCRKWLSITSRPPLKVRPDHQHSLTVLLLWNDNLGLITGVTYGTPITNFLLLFWWWRNVEILSWHKSNEYHQN